MPIDPETANPVLQDKSESMADWYRRYYSKEGANRNNLRANPEVLFQTLAAEAAIVRAFRYVKQDPANAKALDVGCGGGGDLFQLFRMGYRPENVSGIDIQIDRITEGRMLYPQVNLIAGDATQMPFYDASFDLVFESTMFATLPDDVISAAIASEMLRVSHSDSYIVLLDWRTPKPRDPNYKALGMKRLKSLFKVGTATEIAGIAKGALVPPVGRFLSSKMPCLYFPTAVAFPFLVGQLAYVLRVI